MKSKEKLTAILAFSALIGFIICSVYIFIRAFMSLENRELPEGMTDIDNAALIYFTNGLTGLVGGIVATSFGIKPETNTDSTNGKPPKITKLGNLGGLILADPESDSKEKLGFYYVLAYIIIGVAACIIWIILDDNAFKSVSNLATTFFGMAIPIVAAFINE